MCWVMAVPSPKALLDSWDVGIPVEATPLNPMIDARHDIPGQAAKRAGRQVRFLGAQGGKCCH